MSTVERRSAWSFLEADAAERAVFSDLRAVLGHAAATPVAPPNRYREVRRVVAPDGRVYFLKLYRRTQLKNRVRNALTAPRCDLDAQREGMVAARLRAAGHLAPRPVAWGRSGPSSALLLAELPGVPLRDLVAEDRCPRELADRVAGHCGVLLRTGFALPDLSADHVLVDGTTPTTWRLGVLDLHDGAVCRPSRRTLRRCLRRFQRSVRGLAVPRAALLRFAARLCRSAGVAGWTRPLLRSLPAPDTHARYDAAGRAARYARRNPTRAAKELDLLRRVWPGRAGETVLDAPCGAGRLAAPLMALGARWLGTDRSRAMLDEARAAGARPLCLGDARALPFATGAADGVVVFRFLHHLPADDARAAVGEACRVARRFVVASFFHPVSTHNLRRRIGELVGGRPRARHTLARRTLDAWMRAEGFARVACVAETPFVRDLWIAAYERAAPVTRPSG